MECIHSYWPWGQGRGRVWRCCGWSPGGSASPTDPLFCHTQPGSYHTHNSHGHAIHIIVRIMSQTSRPDIIHTDICYTYTHTHCHDHVTHIIMIMSHTQSHVHITHWPSRSCHTHCHDHVTHWHSWSCHTHSYCCIIHADTHGYITHTDSHGHGAYTDRHSHITPTNGSEPAEGNAFTDPLLDTSMMDTLFLEPLSFRLTPIWLRRWSKSSTSKRRPPISCLPSGIPTNMVKKFFTVVSTSDICSWMCKETKGQHDGTDQLSHADTIMSTHV